MTDGSSAGTLISNRAEAPTKMPGGATGCPETVTITIAAVAGRGDAGRNCARTMALHDQVTRPFCVCNNGNNPDTFTPTALDVTAPSVLRPLRHDNSGDFSNGDPGPFK